MFALLGPCPEPPDDPTLLVPDSASAVLGVDVDAFARTPAGGALVSALSADLELAEIVEVAIDCGVPVEQTYALVLARDSGDGRMVAIQARAIGEAKTLECLATEIRARNGGAEPWQPDPTRCWNSLALTGDLGRIWLTNSYTLVWARGAFVDTVGAKLEGSAALGLPSNLATELGRLDRSGHLWLAAKLDAENRAAIPGVWARDADSSTLAVNLDHGPDHGLRAVLTLGAGTSTALASTRDRVLASLVELAERFDEYGIEHRLRERARIGIVDAAVIAEVELDQGELRQLRSAVGERVRGRGPL